MVVLAVVFFFVALVVARLTPNVHLSSVAIKNAKHRRPATRWIRPRKPAVLILATSPDVRLAADPNLDTPENAG